MLERSPSVATKPRQHRQRRRPAQRPGAAEAEPAAPVPWWWLAFLYRALAANAAGRPWAAEDAKRFNAAVARWATSSEAFGDCLGFPTDWKSRKRRYETAAAVQALVGSGYRGRRGARELHRTASAYRASGRFARDREAGTVPDGERGAAYRLLSACGGHLPAESYLARLLK